MLYRAAFNKFVVFFGAFSFVWSADVYAIGDPGTTRKSADIFMEPESASGIIGKLNPKESVLVGPREGLFYELLEPEPGWVKFIAIKLDESSAQRSGLAGLASGREGKGNSVASSGVRGLGAETIATASPDFRELDLMKAASANLILLADNAEDQYREIPLIK